MPDISSSIVNIPQVVGGLDDKGNAQPLSIEHDGALNTVSLDAESKLDEILIELKRANLHNASITDEDIDEVD